jgi:hypothetical protein
VAKAKRPQSRIPIYYQPDALADIKASLDAATQADVVATVLKLDGQIHQDIVALLDERTERKVFQWEGSHAKGTLRIVFAWGKACLWVIGAFVKSDDAHGERLMKRILPRADTVKKMGPPKS